MGMHTFVVRLWLEPTESSDSLPEWRGVIEHISSNQHHYIKDLDEISAFIWPFLVSMNLGGPTLMRRRED